MFSMACYRICRSALLLACACAALSGCGGPSTAEVSGTIKVRGQAPKLEGLQIALLGGDGSSVSAAISADGTYKAVGVPVGDVKVGFVYIPPGVASPGQPKGRLPQPGKGEAPPKGPTKEQPKNPIPENLRDGSTSNLSFKVVSGGNNVFDYDIR
jgi:hypothetical protein